MDTLQSCDKNSMAAAWSVTAFAGVGKTMVRPVLYHTPDPGWRHAHAPFNSVGITACVTSILNEQFVR